MIEIGKKGKIKLKWNVNPYDYSKEKEQSLIAKLSKKYSLPKDRIKILPQFIMLNEKGETTSVATDIISNIQNPQFQLKLFNEYRKSLNNICRGTSFDSTFFAISFSLSRTPTNSILESLSFFNIMYSDLPFSKDKLSIFPFSKSKHFAPNGMYFSVVLTK